MAPQWQPPSYAVPDMSEPEVASNAHLRKDVREFSRQALGDRVIGGESRLELLGSIQRRLAVVACNALDLFIQVAQQRADREMVLADGPRRERLADRRFRELARERLSQRIIELDLNEAELAALRASADNVAQGIADVQAMAAAS